MVFAKDLRPGPDKPSVHKQTQTQKREKMTSAGFKIDFLTEQGLETKSYNEGDEIFASGDPGDHMYVVESGNVEIRTFGSTLDQVGTNDIFGEMAVIDGGPRSASAVATTATKVIAIDKAAFRKISQEDPDFALEVMRRLVERLRRMNHAQIYFK